MWLFVFTWSSVFVFVSAFVLGFVFVGGDLGGVMVRAEVGWMVDGER